MADKPRPVHLLDVRASTARGMATSVCGARVRQRYVTRMGWKVTCDVCNPPVRRKVKIRPLPAPPKMDLEDA